MINPFAPATDKQIRFAETIADRLDLELPEEKTKAAYSDFIEEWIDDYCISEDIELSDYFDER